VGGGFIQSPSTAFETSAIYALAYGNGKLAYWPDGEETFHTRFGFTGKRVTAAGRELVLSDGSNLKLNNGLGLVTWSDS
jgi:ferric-dicitrate binding protein FerR (iron transport regulator)